MPRHLTLALVSVLAIGLSACSNGTTSPSTTTTTESTATTTVAELVVSGNSALTGIGQRTPLTLVANFSDGSASATVTAVAIWQSSDNSIAIVTSGGVVTAVKAGHVHITAFYQGVGGGFDVDIVPIVTTFRGTVTQSDGQRGTFTLTLNGSTAATATKSSEPISGSLTVGSAGYSVSGVLETSTGVVSLAPTTSNAAVKFTAAISNGVLSGSYAIFESVSATFTSTSATVTKG